MPVNFNDSIVDRVMVTSKDGAHVPRRLEALGFRVVHERHGFAWTRDEVPTPAASLRAVEERSGQGGITYRPLESRPPRDTARARVWLERALAQGLQEARADLAALPPPGDAQPAETQAVGR